VVDGIAMVEVPLGLPGMRVLVVAEGDDEVVIELETVRRRGGAGCVGCALRRRTGP
jgi:hypothetical protein